MHFMIDDANIFAIRTAIRTWTRLLSTGNFADALDFLSPLSGSERTYTTDSLMRAIGNYSRRYREACETEKVSYLPQVTDPAVMSIKGETFVAYLSETDDIVVNYDLPIDGEWSDLTAQFRIFPVGTKFGLALNDLHVL